MLWLLEQAENVTFQELLPLLPQLSEARRNRVLSMRHEPTQVQMILAGLLLRFALEAEYGLTKLPRMETGEKGKPFFPELPELHFNLSHCRTAVACALDGAAVGVDAETYGRLLQAPRRPSTAAVTEQGTEKPLLQAGEGDRPQGRWGGRFDDRALPSSSEPALLRVLSDPERQWVLAGESPAEQDRRFTAVWTCKEAYGKARSDGILYDLKSTCFFPHVEPWQQGGYSFYQLRQAAFCLTLCTVSESVPPLRSIRLSNILEK